LIHVPGPPCVGWEHHQGRCPIAIGNVALAKHVLGNADISIIKTYSTLDEIFQAKRR
jgi:hypothetical protein